MRLKPKCDIAGSVVCTIIGELTFEAPCTIPSSISKFSKLHAGKAKCSLYAQFNNHFIEFTICPPFHNHLHPLKNIKFISLPYITKPLSIFSAKNGRVAFCQQNISLLTILSPALFRIYIGTL